MSDEQNINIQSDSSLNPDEVYDDKDPGDETQRNYRYQHAYGVILIIASLRNEKPYTSLWCEHHEDFLCERNDDLYDGYQIKTRKPEIGPWSIKDEDIRKSIRRFVELYKRFPDKIGDFYFVSNTDYLNVGLAIKDQTKLGKSPIRFFEEIKRVNSEESIGEAFKPFFIDLKNFCNCDSELFLLILKKIRLIKGPGRDSFDAEISHDHISRLKGCESYSPSILNSVRDELVQKVYEASSLKVDDPGRHYYCLHENTANNPYLNSKKLIVGEMPRIIYEVSKIPFRFSPGIATINLSSGEGNLNNLRKKMLQGNIGSQFKTMERRALSAESNLIELAHFKPEKIDPILNQIVSMVQGECDEASHAAKLISSNFGPVMLNDVYKRLRDIAENHPQKVEHQPYECLVGIAGLLTGECSIWWSKPFDLGEME